MKIFFKSIIKRMFQFFAIVFLGLLIILVVILLFISLFTIGDASNKKDILDTACEVNAEFDSTKWHQRIYSSDRAEMYNDIVFHKLKTGTQFNKVRELLGLPAYIRTYGWIIKTGCYQYTLDAYSGAIGASTYYLIVCPDKTGQVVESAFIYGSDFYFKYRDWGESKEYKLAF